MNIRLLIETYMGRTVLIALFLALIGPFLIVVIDKRKPLRKIHKYVLLIAYAVVIFFLTLLDRDSGETSAIYLTPFWTYSNLNVSALRWQIYLNVLLFVPFGFLVPFSTKAGLLKTLGIAAALSAVIEMCQYVFSLGLCEIDDLIHNTIGGALGYVYWRLIKRVK